FHFTNQPWRPRLQAERLKLISPFNSLSSSLAGATIVPRFVQAYHLDCPLNRPLQSYVPATIEIRAASNSSASSAAAIAHRVQTFITAMDAVNLNMVANDQVRPLLQDVATSMARHGPLLPSDFYALQNWCVPRNIFIQTV
ncbi:vacuolar protein sorting-associated protein 28 homolog 1-like, partial [Panicum hallii]|uniref:vacuolar protein sorting-associated protein 28 homolog 1-like n=1 Tax=Panicum hallii TaxID=206008 RepID=UPI000DF4DCE1